MGLSGVWTALDGFALMCIVPSIARFFRLFLQAHFFLRLHFCTPLSL